MPRCVETTGHCMHQQESICCRPDLFGPPSWTPVDTIHRDECYVGLSTYFDYGQLDQVGCGLGCAHCPDYPSDLIMMADLVQSRRWLAPHPTLPARDAWGYLSDVVGDNAGLIPRVVHYVRGTCNDNYGTECFGVNVCSCFGDNSLQNPNVVQVGPEEFYCMPGFKVSGQAVEGLYPDQFVAVGMGWPLVGIVNQPSVAYGQVYCRRFQDSLNGAPDHRVVIVAPTYHGMIEPIFVRTSETYAAYILGACQANMLIPCTARVAAGPDHCDGFGYPHYVGGQLHDPPTHYNEGETRTQFDELRITGNTASISTDMPQMPYADKAVIEAKNKVLEFVRGDDFDVRFDRLDYDLVTEQNNRGLNHWSRTWRAESIADGRVVPNIFGRCWLLFSGAELDIELRVMRVTYALYLTLHHRKSRPARWIENHTIEPHARMRIVVECAVVARVIEPPAILTQAWLPDYDPDHTVTIEVDEPDAASRMPAITPDIDRIAYCDTHGRTIEPFASVEWWGYLGRASRPSSRQAENPIEIDTVPGACASAGRVVNGLEIPGWPYAKHTNPDMPATLYTGNVRLGL